MRKTLLCFCVLALPVVSYAGDTNLPGRLVVQTDDATVPTCASATADGDICVGDDLQTIGDGVVGGALTSTGALTASSTLDVTGAATFSAAVTISQGVLSGQTVGFDDKTTDYTVLVADCGTVISSNDDNRVFTLPAVAAANAGCTVTVINTAAADQSLISVSPNANDGMFGGCCYVNDAATTVCTAFSGTDNKDLQNTKAEQNKGDFVTVTSDGSTGWYTIACYGSWASEA